MSQQGVHLTPSLQRHSQKEDSVSVLNAKPWDTYQQINMAIKRYFDWCEHSWLLWNPVHRRWRIPCCVFFWLDSCFTCSHKVWHRLCLFSYKSMGWQSIKVLASLLGKSRLQCSARSLFLTVTFSSHRTQPSWLSCLRNHQWHLDGVGLFNSQSSAHP